MAEDNVNINLDASDFSGEDTPFNIEQTGDINNTGGPINPLLNLPNPHATANAPLINSVELPNEIKESKDLTAPELSVPSNKDYTYPQLTQSSIQEAIREMDTSGYFKNAYGAGLISPATLKAIETVAAPINQYLNADLYDMNSNRPSRTSLDDDPYGQIYGDYDKDSDLGLAQGMENAFAKTALETPEDKAPGWRDPVIFGARAMNLDRYMAHPTFHDNGFHPFRDNEAYYNDGRATRFQNGRRTFNAYWDMFWSAAGGNYRSAKDVAKGNILGSDLIGAQSMEDAMRIASSTRGGVGGWVNDFMLNSAYTFGTIFSIVVEEAAMAIALYGTKSPALAQTAVARTGVNLKRLLKSIPALFDMRKAAAASTKILNQMKRIDLARDWRKMALATGSAAVVGGKKILTFLAPETTLAMRRIATAGKTGENITSLAKVADGVGGFYRDLRMMNMALAEGKMEGGLVEMKVREKLYHTFTEKYGRAPNDDEMTFIMNQSITAAANTTLFNAPIIFASNAVVLKNMFGGFKGLNRMMEETASGIGRRVFRNPNFKPGKRVKNSKGKVDGDDAWFYADSFFGHMNQLRKMGFKKGWGKHMGAAALRYTGANFMEGFQEVYQEAVASGMEHYYAGMYEDPIMAGMDITAAGILEPQIGGKEAIKAAALKGINSQMSKEGVSVFMSGFLMGGLLGPTTNIAFKHIPNLFRSVADKKGWQEYKTAKDTYIKNVVQTLNDIYNDPEFYANPTKLNAIIQKQLSHRMSQSTMANDTQEFMDARHQSMYNDIYTAITLGKFGDMKEYYEGFIDMSDAEIKEAFRDSKKTPDKIRDGFRKAITKLEDVKKQYDKFDSKYVNPFDPGKYKEGTRVWAEEVIRQKAYHQAKMLLLFQKDAMKDATTRMNQIQNELIAGNKALEKVRHDDIFVLTSRKRMNSEIDRLKKWIKFTKADTPELKAEKDKKKRKLKHLEDVYDVLFDPKNQVQSAGKMKDWVLTDAKGKAILGKDNKPIKIPDPNSPTGFRQIPENERDFIMGGYNKRPAYMKKLKTPFLAYLKFLAEVNGDTLENENVDDTLKKLIDNQHLGARVADYYRATEILSNPDNLLHTSYRIAEVMNKQWNRYKNSHYRRVKQFVSTQERHQFLKDLAMIGVFPDPQQVKEFLSKDVEELTVDDIPDIFFSEEGLVTQEESPDLYDQIQSIVGVMEQVINPESFVDPNVDTDTTTEEGIDTETTNIDEDSVETKEEKEQIKEDVMSLDEFKNSKTGDKGTIKILDREWEKEKMRRLRTTGELPTEQDKQIWLADGTRKGGLRYLDGRWRAYKVYQETPIEEKTGPNKKLLTFDEWLLNNIRENPKISRDIVQKMGLGVYDLLVQEVTDQKTKLDALEQDGAKIIKAYPNLNMYVVKVPSDLDKTGKVVDNWKIVDIDNVPIVTQFSELRQEHPDLDWGRRGSYPNQLSALNAAKEIAKIVPTSEVFKFDGEDFKLGDILIDKDGGKWFITSNSAQVDADGYIRIKNIDSNVSKDKLYSKILPTEWADQKWKKEELKKDRWDQSIIQGNVQKLRLREPVSFFTNDRYLKGMLSPLELRDFLNKLTPEITSKLKVKVILNPRWEADSKIKIEDRKPIGTRPDKLVNNNLKKAEPKYIIRLILPGPNVKERGKEERFIQLQGLDTLFVDPKDKTKEINPLAMTRDQFLQYFYPPSPLTNKTLDQAFEQTLQRYASLKLIYDAFGQALEESGKDTLEIDLFDKDTLTKQIVGNKPTEKKKKILQKLQQIETIINPGSILWYKDLYTKEKYETKWDKLKYKYVTEINGEGKIYIIDNNKGTSIHNFDESNVDEELALKEFQTEFGNWKQKYKNVLDKLGRYVLVIKQPNGVISLVELKADKLEETTANTILSKLITRQEETVKGVKQKGNIKRVKGKKEVNDPKFNYTFNDNLSDDFYVEGNDNDQITIGVGPMGGIIVKYTKDKGLPTQRVEIVPLTDKDMHEVNTFQEFLKRVNSKWNEKQEELAKKDENYVILPLIDDKGLTMDRFRVGIPLYADETMVEKVIAKVSPDVRNPQIQIHYNNQEEIQAIINAVREANRNIESESNVNEKPEVEKEDAVVIKAEDITKWTAEKWETVPNDILESLANKAGNDPENNLETLEKIVYDKANIAQKIKDGEIQIEENVNPNNDSKTNTEDNAAGIQEQIDLKIADIAEYKAKKAEEITVAISTRDEYVDINDVKHDLTILDQSAKSLLMINELNNFEQYGDNGLNQLNAELNTLKKRAEELANEDSNFSIVDPDQLNDHEVENIDNFIAFIKRIFPPDVISIEDINQLRAKLRNNGMTMGAFVMALEQVSSGIPQFKGKIYTAPGNIHKYHEAFHAIFRMLLPDKTINELLEIAKKETRKKLRKEGITLKDALTEFRLKSPVYQQLWLSDKRNGTNLLEDRFYEEWLADEFDKFKMNPRSSKAPSQAKSFFQKIIDWITQLFTRADKNELINIFQDIDSGKFSTGKINSNMFTRKLERKMARGEGIAVDQGVSVPDDITFSIQLKTGTIPLYENYYDEDKKGWKRKLVDKDIYMNANDVNLLISNISALYLDRWMKVKGEFYPPGMIRRTVTDYIEMYNPTRKFYTEDPNIAKFIVKLNTKYKSLLENQAEIEEGVAKYIKLFDMNVSMDDIDINSNYENDYAKLFDENGVPKDSEWEAEPQGIGGFRSLSKALRIFIATTTLPETDAFQNPSEIPTNIWLDDAKTERHRVSVNYIDAYNGLLRAVRNSKNEMHMLQKMVEFKDTSVHAAAVIDKFFRRMGISDPEKLLEEGADFPISQVEATDPTFFNQVIKGLNQYVVDYLFVEKSQAGSDVRAGTISIYAANTKDDAHEQIKRWQNKYITLADVLQDPDNIKGREAAADVISKLKGFLTSARKSINDNDTYKDDGLLKSKGLTTLSKELSLDLFKNTGIRLSAGYIRYSIIHNINNNILEGKSKKSLSNKQKLILNNNIEADPITFDDLVNFEGSIRKGENLFARINSETGTDKTEDTTQIEDIPLNPDQQATVKQENVGIEFRLKKFARGNALFDETVGTTVFKDPEGNLIYSHQMPTFHLEKVAELNSEDKINELLEDGYLSKNALLSDNRFLNLARSGKLKVMRLSGSKESVIKQDNVSGKFVGSFSGSPGITYGDSSPNEFLESLINLYLYGYNPQNGLVNKTYDTDESGKDISFATAPILLRVIEASNTGDFVALPIRKAVEYADERTKEVKLTDQTFEYFINELKIAYENIQKNVQEIDSNEKIKYDGYNDIDSVDEIQDYELDDNGNIDFTKPIEDKQRGFKLGNVGRVITSKIPKDSTQFIFPTEFKGIPVQLVDESKATIKHYFPVSYKNGTIFIVPQELQRHFGRRSWTTSIELPDGSRHTPLKSDVFGSYSEFATFAMEYAIQLGNISKADAAKMITDKNVEFTQGMYIDQLQEAALNAVKDLDGIKNQVKFKGVKMIYSFKGNRRAGVTADTTIEAIRRGERTATTRYKSDRENSEWQKVWSKVQVNDVIEFVGKDNSKVYVRITNARELNQQTDPESWSRKEGWSTKYFKNNVFEKLTAGAVQFDYEVLGEYQPEKRIQYKDDRSFVDSLQELARQGDIDFDSALEQVFESQEQLKSIIQSRLKYDYEEFYKLLEKLNIIERTNEGVQVNGISSAFKNGLIDKDGNTNDNTKSSMLALNLKQFDLNYNLQQVFFNDYMNTRSINQLLLGDQAISLKNSIDAIKRAKGQNGAGPTVASIIGWNKYNIQAFNEIDAFMHEDLTHRSEFTVDEQDEDGDSTDTQDSGDAMVHVTLNGFKHFEFGIGQLNENQADMIQMMEGEGAANGHRSGVDPTNNEWFGDPNFNTKGQKDNNAAINSRKYVYFDGKTMGKMSVVTLTPSYTSLKDKNGEYTIARPGKEKEHNLRIKMEKHEFENKRIAMAYPKSASKMMNMFLADTDTAFSNRPMVENGKTNWRPRILDANMLRLQQVTPSGKTEIVDPRQIKMLITSEQNPNAKVRIPWLNDGKPTKVSDIIKEYDKLTSLRLQGKFSTKRNLIFDFKQKYGNQVYSGMLLKTIKNLRPQDITVDLSTFLKYAVAGLESGKTKDQLVAFFKPDKFGRQRNLNNPLTLSKFQELYFSFWKDTVAERQPGVSLTLRSSMQSKQLKVAGKIDPDTGQPIPGLARTITFAEQDLLHEGGTLYDIIGNITQQQKQYVDRNGNTEFITDESGTTRINPDYDSRDQLFENGAISEGDFYYDELRYDIDEYDENGEKTGETYSEFMMPPHFHSILENWKPGEVIPDSIAKAFGIRIPSQDKHSAINLKVVNFMPSYFGSQGVFARQLIEVSGADFDIDTLYTHIKEHFVEKTIIKSSETIEAEFQEWSNSEQYSPEVDRATKNKKDIRHITHINRREHFGSEFDEHRARAEFAKFKGYPIKVKKIQELAESNNDKVKNIADIREAIENKKTKVEVSFRDVYKGEIKEYGTAKTIEKEYEEYLRYQIKEAKTPGSTMSLAMSKYSDKINDELLKNLEDKKLTQDEYNKKKFNFTKIEKDLVDLVNENSPIKEIKEVFKVSNLLKAGLREQKLPVNIDSYKKWKQDMNGDLNVGGAVPFAAPYNNRILDLKFALLGNDGMQDIKNEPAVTKPLEDYLDDVEQELPELYELIQEAGVDIDTLFGKGMAFKANKEGERNIGSVVVKNSGLSFLSQHGIELLKNDFADHQLKFNNQIFFKFNTPEDKNGVRTQYVISALITAMTDNAKLRLADKLGLNRHALGIVTVMLALGIDTRTALDTVNQPLVKKMYVELDKGQGYGPAFIIAGYNDIITDIAKKKMDALESKFDSKTFEEIKKDLIARADKMGTPEGLRNTLKKFYETDFVDALSPEYLDSLSIEELIDINTGLLLFSKAMNVSKYVGKLASLTTLLSGFGRDITALEDRNISFEELGLTGPWKAKIPFDIRPYILSKADLNKIKLPADVRNKQTDTILSTYYYANKEFETLLPKVFLSYTAPFKLISNHIFSNYTGNKYIMTPEERQKISTEIVGYLMVKGYQHQLSDDPKSKSSLSNAILYDQIEGKKLYDYTKELKGILEAKGKKNAFIDDFLYIMNTKHPDNKKGIVRGISNTWITVGEMQQIFNQNSFLELFNDSETRPYAYDLMHYLLVKDGMKWEMDTFIDSIPAQIFDGPLASIGKIHELFGNIYTFKELKEKEEVLKGLFGVGFKDLVKEMENMFVASKGGHRIVKLKNIKLPKNSPLIISQNRRKLSLNMMGGVASLKEHVRKEGDPWLRQINFDKKISISNLNEEQAEQLSANISLLERLGLIYNSKIETERDNNTGELKEVEYPMFNFPLILKKVFKTYRNGEQSTITKYYGLNKVYNSFVEDSTDLYDPSSSNPDISGTRGVRADYIELTDGLMGSNDQWVFGYMFSGGVPLNKNIKTDKVKKTTGRPMKEDRSQMSESEKKSYDESLQKQAEQMSQYNGDAAETINVEDGGPNKSNIETTFNGKTDNPANMTSEEKGLQEDKGVGVVDVSKLGEEEKNPGVELQEADKILKKSSIDQISEEEKGAGEAINIFEQIKNQKTEEETTEEKPAVKEVSPKEVVKEEGELTLDRDSIDEMDRKIYGDKVERMERGKITEEQYLKFKKLEEEGKFSIEEFDDWEGEFGWVGWITGFYSKEYFESINKKQEESSKEFFDKKYEELQKEKVGEQAKMEQTEAIEKEVEWDNHLDTLVDDEMKNGTGTPLDQLDNSFLEEYTMHSGGAPGADSIFSYEFKKLGGITVKHYYGVGQDKGRKVSTQKLSMPGKKQGTRILGEGGNVSLDFSDSEQGKKNKEYADNKLKKANISLGRSYPTKSEFANLLLRRNVQQIDQATMVVAFGKFTMPRYAQELKLSKVVDGGTGWAVQMAIDDGKSVYLFNMEDKKWYENHGMGWEEMDTIPSLRKNFAGIGSREVSFDPDSREAMRQVIEKTIRVKNYVKATPEMQAKSKQGATKEKSKPTINTDISSKIEGSQKKISAAKEALAQIITWYAPLTEKQKIQIIEKGNFKSNHNDIIGFQLEILEELPNIHTKQDGKTIVEKLKCLL